jgi:unsaturated chondroitin disaccharide hydrolase
MERIMGIWNEAIGRIRKRMTDTRESVGKEYPHWADQQTGKWTTTVDGDWTGGCWAGMHWLCARCTGEKHYRTQAAALAQGLKKRIAVETVFKSFPFYFGAALGSILFEERAAKELALAAARSLAVRYGEGSIDKFEQDRCDRRKLELHRAVESCPSRDDG